MKLPKLKNVEIPKSRWTILICLAVVLMGIILVFRHAWGGVKQPIAFNHKIHAENDLECLDCHQLYKDHASSGRPLLETCAGCHEDPIGESKGEKKLVEHIQSGIEIEWQRLYRVPEDVYFSHRRHVVLADIMCANCHGAMEERTKPPSRPLEKITMKRCMSCHEDKGANNDCISCHR